MRSRASSTFRPHLGGPMGGEGLEERRLLNGGGKVVAIERLRANDAAEIDVSRRALKVAAGEDQAKALEDRAASGALATAQASASDGNGGYSVPETAVSSPAASGENNSSDSAENGSTPLGGSSPRRLCPESQARPRSACRRGTSFPAASTRAPSYSELRRMKRRALRPTHPRPKSHRASPSAARLRTPAAQDFQKTPRPRPVLPLYRVRRRL